jgi:hypothetical protein
MVFGKSAKMRDDVLRRCFEIKQSAEPREKLHQYRQERIRHLYAERRLRRIILNGDPSLTRSDSDCPSIPISIDLLDAGKQAPGKKRQ